MIPHILNFKTYWLGLLLVLFGFFYPTAPFAQNIKPVVHTETQTYALHAKTNGQEYRLFVSLPASYNEKDTVHYPVLYLVDGNPFFSLMQSMQQFFVTGEEVQQLIIVGIGYPVKDVVESMPYRTRDYTPTSDTAFNHMIDDDLKLRVHTTSGGAALFMQTLKQDIFPFIEQRYKTNAERGFAGHSFGALFGAYVLFHEPALFHKYLLSSVSIPWDHNEMLQEEQQFYQAGNHSLPAQVYVSVGSEEPNGMQPLMHQLVASIQAHHYQGLQLNEHVLEHETHTSAVTTAFNHGLRELYSKTAKKD